jgi:hypothetical protein
MVPSLMAGLPTHTTQPGIDTRGIGARRPLGRFARNFRRRSNARIAPLLVSALGLEPSSYVEYLFTCERNPLDPITPFDKCMRDRGFLMNRPKD